jgi:prepilin-type N-terminal cleavage/methylation domain-containing protein
VKEQPHISTPASPATRVARRQAGFSLIEIIVVVALIIVVSAMAMVQMRPIMADADMDAAMRQVIDQIRQAREYSITNRRYVQVAFPTVTLGGGTRYEVVVTQMNSDTPGAGTTNPVLTTTIIEAPAQYLLLGGPDTPDAFGNTSAIEFEGTSGGPVGGMLFQSDGELVDGSTFQPINGTVFLGNPGTATSARAITVLGSTGRVRGWKGTGTVWTQF